MRCNVYLNSNWPEYMDFMLDTYGRRVITALRKQDKRTRSFTEEDLLALETEFKEKLNLL